MKSVFSDAIADTREAFIDLVRNTSATFYEVYTGIPNSDLEGLFDSLHEGEACLRFDVLKHSDQARSRFLDISEIERRAYEFSDDVKERPLPYFGAFVPGMGPIGMAWTRDEIGELIVRTRQDEVRMKEVAEFIRSQEKNDSP